MQTIKIIFSCLYPQAGLHIDLRVNCSFLALAQKYANNCEPVVLLHDHGGALVLVARELLVDLSYGWVVRVYDIMLLHILSYHFRTIQMPASEE